jgi:hypothetical protein
MVNFFYEDDKMSVNVFDKESCCIHYHDDSSGDDSDDDGEEEDWDHPLV